MMSMSPSSNGKQPISIVIAEDHTLFSEGTRLMLESTGNFSPIAQAVTGKQAVELVRQNRPQVVLMDIVMPEMNGLHAARIIKAEFPSTKIIMLTSFTDEKTVHIALSGGADAYCSKEIDMQRLLSVIQMVLEGAVYLDPAVAKFVLNSYAKQKANNATAAPLPAPPPAQKPCAPLAQANSGSGPQDASSSEKSQETDDAKASLPLAPQQTPATPLSSTNEMPAAANRPILKLDTPKPTPIRTDVLTARELELLSLIADYRSNEEIADILKIGSAWVDGYIKNIVTKLAVENEVEAVRRAMEDGVLKQSRLLDEDHSL